MKCLIYYSVDNGEGFPTPGIMQGYTSEQCHCHLIKLPSPTDDPVPSPTPERVYSKTGLRYFVRIDCDTNQVMPNSLFASYKHPGGNVLEFIKYAS